MPSGGPDFLKGYPKPHRDPGVLQHLQGLSAQQEEVQMHESRQLQPFQLPPRSVLPVGLQCLWETSSHPGWMLVGGCAENNAGGGGNQYK